VPIVLKSGSLNLLEPSGPVQAYSGIGLLYIFEVLMHPKAEHFWNSVYVISSPFAVYRCCVILSVFCSVQMFVYIVCVHNIRTVHCCVVSILYDFEEVHSDSFR